MAVQRRYVEDTKNFMIARDQNHGRAPYRYGGQLSTDPRVGTDCSEIWQTVLEMVHGRWVPGRQQEGATTESYRYIPVGGVGPFGTIRVAHWRDIPVDAAAKLAFHHEGNGGASSHMWGVLDGLHIESGGSKGVVTGDPAWRIDNPYANAWAYLPGPILAGTNGDIITLAQGSKGNAVVVLQAKLNAIPHERGGANPRLDEDGDYGVLTAAAVMWYQQVNNLNEDVKGVAGPQTQKHLGLASSNPPAPPVSDDGALVLAKVMGNRVSIERYRELQPAFRDCVNRCNAATPKRINMLVAQLGHESGGLKYMEEIADGSAYEGRRDLGNIQPGDGKRYKGRGPIQITGRHNYTELSKWAFSKGYVPSPDFFVVDPAKLASVQYGFLGVVWYWTIARPKINSYCDYDNLEDSLQAVTRAINGGLHGLDDRRNYLNRARSMDLAPIMRGSTPVVTPPPVQPPTQGPNVEHLSREEQRTVYEAAKKLLTPVKSESTLATAGEGTVGDPIDLISAIDANTHPPFSEWVSDLGDTNEIERLTALANVDLSRFPEKAYSKRLAYELLKKINGEKETKVVNVTNTAAPASEVRVIEVEKPVYIPTPAPAPETVQKPVVDPQSKTTGQLAGEVYDALSILQQRMDEMPPEAAAPLNDLGTILAKAIPKEGES